MKIKFLKTFLNNLKCHKSNIQKNTENVVDNTVLNTTLVNNSKIEEVQNPITTNEIITTVELINITKPMKNDILVLLDPGHGKEVPGKRSLVLPDGRQLFEWAYAREIAHRIQDCLNNIGVKSEITNKTDKEIGLSKRAEIANEFCKTQKCILVSIHCNAAGDGKTWTKANGWEVWSTESKNNSDKLAQCFLDVYKEIFPNRNLRGHKEKNFTVLYKTNCPCVLTENFFMDNKEECEFLLSEKGKNDIVNLHVKAILKYINL